jgi:hypothetical protein
VNPYWSTGKCKYRAKKGPNECATRWTTRLLNTGRRTLRRTVFQMIGLVSAWLPEVQGRLTATFCSCGVNRAASRHVTLAHAVSDTFQLNARPTISETQEEELGVLMASRTLLNTASGTVPGTGGGMPCPPTVGHRWSPSSFLSVPVDSRP